MPVSPQGSRGLLTYNFGQQQAMPENQGTGAQAGQNRPHSPVPDELQLEGLSKRAQETGDRLGMRLQNRWEEWMLSRRYIEEDWLRYVRAYNGVYENAVFEKFRPGQSQVFVQLTRMKTDTSFNRLSDLLFGAEPHWDLNPSPIPELSPERKEQLRAEIMNSMMFEQQQMQEQMAVEAAQGMPPMPVDALDMQPPTDEELKKVEDAEAKRTCKNMRMKIKDQLEAENYERKARDTIFEMCLVGTGCFKGPMTGTATSMRYQKTLNGWEMGEEEDTMPKMESVSIFDLYPDPYATETKKGMGVYQRHVMRKDQVDRLSQQPYFIEEKVEELLEMYPNGNHWDSYTDIELRFVSGQSVTGEPERRYDLIEFWGWIDGRDLKESGLRASKELELEDHKSYYCNVWTSGGVAIKATMSPNKPTKEIYKFVPYKKVLASVWGVGVPFLMQDSQATVNAASRELINNAALSSGPQVEVAVDLIELDANEDIRVIDPWRVWTRIGGDLAYPAVRFTNVPNTTESMAKIIQIWRAFADEETMIPSYTHGSTALSGAAGKTASGMSMMMGAASMDIKGVVKNWDQYQVKPFIEDMYHWNMQWTADEEIKGDFEPAATGSSSLLAKEIKSQRVIMLLEMTNNPVDNAIMGPERRARLLRQGAEAMDIDPDDLAPNPDEEDVVGEAQNNMGMGMPVPGGGGAGGASNVPPAPGTGGPGGAPRASANPAQPGGPGMGATQPPVAPATGRA